MCVMALVGSGAVVAAPTAETKSDLGELITTAMDAVFGDGGASTSPASDESPNVDQISQQLVGFLSGMMNSIDGIVAAGVPEQNSQDPRLPNVCISRNVWRWLVA
jgi:hypothetical protein